MFLPLQTSLPAVPVPSSVNVTEVRDATSAAIVLIELEVTPVQEEVNIQEPVQEPVKYDPNKKYTWNTDDIFVINGAEFGVILNSLRAQLATEEAARILLANRANNTVEQVLARSVEAGVIKEAEEAPKQAGL